MTLAKNPGVHVSSTRNPYVVSCTVGVWNTFDQPAPAKTHRSLEDVNEEIQEYEVQQRDLNRSLAHVKSTLAALRQELKLFEAEEFELPPRNYVSIFNQQPVKPFQF